MIEGSYSLASTPGHSRRKREGLVSTVCTCIKLHPKPGNRILTYILKQSYTKSIESIFIDINDGSAALAYALSSVQQ